MMSYPVAFPPPPPPLPPPPPGVVTEPGVGEGAISILMMLSPKISKSPLLKVLQAFTKR